MQLGIFDVPRHRTGPARRFSAIRSAGAVAFASALGALAICPAQAAQFDSLFHPAPTLAPGAAPDPLRTPPVYRSQNGELRVTLEAKESMVKLGPYEIRGSTYDGVYGGPVLRLKPGDTLRLTLVNHLPQATNIHFHGLEVSPEGHGDNSMHMVGPGQTWEYVIPIPKDHPPGVYWFHTHAHSFAERQLMGGLSGTLVIEGFQDEVAATKPLRERLMALKEFAPEKDGELATVPKPFNFVIKTINGQLIPRIDIQPGETQLWRLSDQTANTYFRLRLDGHRFTIIGEDAHPVVHPEATKEIILGPSSRMDVLVTAGAAGTYKLIAEKTDTGPAGDRFPAQVMGVMAVAPDPSQPPPAPRAPLTVAAVPTQKPIPGDHIDARRLVTFSEDPVTGLFFINHQTFDPERVDVKVPLGSIEEWTIRNSSDELHIFHIHQVAFQIISVNGKPVPFDGLVDTVSVPIHGEVKVRIAFTDPAIVGRFMFHCHILEHEDKGMMAQIEVYDPKVGPMPEGHDMAGMVHTHLDTSNGTTANAAHD
jgi:FtsP/CotA-like multicopper oxidase with cupredoxin domain